MAFCVVELKEEIHIKIHDDNSGKSKLRKIKVVNQKSLFWWKSKKSSKGFLLLEKADWICWKRERADFGSRWSGGLV